MKKYKERVKDKKHNTFYHEEIQKKNKHKKGGSLE